MSHKSKPTLSAQLTILFNVVIWIVVSTPGGHLGEQVQWKIARFSFHSASLTLIKGENTHWDHSWVVGQKVAWCDMTCLVFSATNVQRQLNRALWTKIITGAVLRKESRETFSLQSVAQAAARRCIQATLGHVTDWPTRVYSPWSTAFCLRCHHLWEVWDLMTWEASAQGQKVRTLWSYFI